LDVKDANTGEVANWSVELGNPTSLMRLGWTRTSMKPMDVVTMQGSLARDGRKQAYARNVMFADTGKELRTSPIAGSVK
jgi:hypothetical protein